MHSLTSTITSKFSNGCDTRTLADGGTEEVTQHRQQPYIHRGRPYSPECSGLSSDQCPICLQPCPYEGPHEKSILVSCGHLYGMACIHKWIQRQSPHVKCPQCNKKCKAKDVMKIYASPADEQLSEQRRIQALEDEIVSLRASNSALIHMAELSCSVYNAQQNENRALKVMLTRDSEEKWQGYLAACTEEDTSSDDMLL